MMLPIRHVICNDCAYFALVDVNAYESDLPDWDYHSLGEHIITQMRMGRIVAWGTPEEELSIEIRWGIPRHSEKPYRRHTQLFKATGPVVLAGYDTLTMCAQFAHYTLPQDDDVLIDLKPGFYRVTIDQTFKWDSDEQFSKEKPEAVDYILTIQEVDSFVTQAITEVPWAP